MTRPYQLQEQIDRSNFCFDAPFSETPKEIMWWFNQIGDRGIRVDVNCDTQERDEGTFQTHSFCFKLFNTEFLETGFFMYVNDKLEHDTLD